MVVLLTKQLQKRKLETIEKKVNLPKTLDIKKLTNYLEDVRISRIRELKDKFTFCAWKSLAEAILIIIQIFNWRRAGEIERELILLIIKIS